MPGLDALVPPLRPGERVSLLVADDSGRSELLGFVVELDADAVTVVDRHGVEHRVTLASVQAGRRVPIARGRNPQATPRAELDALAARAGVAGEPLVARISDVLAGRPPVAQVPAPGASGMFGGASALAEGEWLTLGDADPDAVVAACWWATRTGQRSVQVRSTRARPDLDALGFAPHSR